MKGKKGQVNTLAPAILALVFAAVVLVFGLVITQELRDTTGGVSVSVTNETLTTVNEDGETVATAGVCRFASFSVTEIYNESGDVVIPSNNYTVSASTGTVTYSGGEGGVAFGFNNTDWDVTYTYTWGDTACEAANSTVIGLGTFADFWEIIVLAIVITVVIGLLLVIFGGTARRVVIGLLLVIFGGTARRR